MVPIKKSTRKIHICTNFQDLNKDFPKDDFSFPNINILVDVMAVHAILSLTDDFFGYNHICMATKDQHEITFTKPWPTFCYKFISFGLKNIGATYQYCMTYIFNDYMHDIVEDYVDDLLAKSKSREEHPGILCKVLDILLEHNVRRNPKKYVFKFASRNLLGFIISN